MKLRELVSADLARGYGLLHGKPVSSFSPCVVTPDELHSRQDQIGDGYGIPTPACVEAIRLLARHDGIVLDPTYTGKAMAGLIADVRAGALSPEETILFLHTGGVPAIFAHAESIVGA